MEHPKKHKANGRKCSTPQREVVEIYLGKVVLGVREWP